MVTGAQKTTSISLAWMASGSIDRFEVTYNYTVNRCLEQGPSMIETITRGSARRTHILSDLNEDSSYTITVRAINTVGLTMDTITADTLTASKEKLSS